MSVAASLATLGRRSAAGRRIAVLTDMLELGAAGADRHAELATPLQAARVDLVFCAGPLMRALFDVLPAARRGAWAASAEDLLLPLADAIGAGDIVLVKGSHGSKASAVVEGLTAMAAAWARETP